MFHTSSIDYRIIYCTPCWKLYIFFMFHACTLCRGGEATKELKTWLGKYFLDTLLSELNITSWFNTYIVPSLYSRCVKRKANPEGGSLL